MITGDARIPMASSAQLAIVIMVVGTFIVGYFLIYPGGLALGGNYPYVSNNSPPSVSIEGLKDVYQVGDSLSFSIRLDGSWGDDVEFPDTTIMKIKDAQGLDTKELVWTGKGVVKTPEEYANDPQINIKAIYIKGNATHPIKMEQAGLYSVSTTGKGVEGAVRNFRVVE